MGGDRLDALRSWVGRYRLAVAGLDRRTRSWAYAGVGLAALAAVVMLVTSLDGRTVTDQPCLTGGPPWSMVSALAVAVASTTFGLGALAAAGAAARTWPWPRLRFIAVIATPLLLALAELITMPVVGAGHDSLLRWHVRAVWPFLTLVGLLAVVVATRGRGPRRPRAAAWTVLLGMVGFAGHTAATWVTNGACNAVITAGDNLALVGFFAIIALPALLIWLGVGGLRLSGELGDRVMARVPGKHLLRLLLVAKILVIAALASWWASGRAPGWLAALPPSGPALLIAVPVVVMILVLLSREQRWIRPGPDAFAAVSLGFAALVTVILLAVPAYGVTALFSALIERSALGLALAVTTVVAVVGGILLRRRVGPWLGLVLITGAVIAYALLLWAYAHSGPFRMAGGVVGDMDLHRVALLLGVPAVLVVVAVAVVLTRPRFRGLRLFFLALLLWVAVTSVLPAVLASRPGTNAVAVDLVLTAGIAVFAVLLGFGRQRQVSAYELVLLLITTTVIVEGPVLIAALPPAADLPLLVFAFVAPAVAMLGPDARSLVGAPLQGERLLARVGVAGVGYGLLGVLAALAQNPLGYLQDLAGLVNGAAALPFAVILVAVRSAQARAPAPTP